MQSDYTIVFPPTMLWANHQRPHHVLTQLARRHPVRCLFNDWTVGEQVLEDGRLIVTKHAFRRRYHEGPLVYYFSIPDKLGYLRRPPFPRPDLYVFELMDLPEAEFSDWKRRLPQALQRADIIRTTHPGITAYLHEHHEEDLVGKEITTSYNGVDLELFDPVAKRTRPPELAEVDKPILGFYGNLDGWIDWPLIGKLAQLPDYHVVVVGGTEGMAPKIPEAVRDAVIWIDKRPVSEMPDFLSSFDVALYPFVVNEMTDAVDPLKVWEYFAFGKPVLATRTSLVRERPALFQAVDAGPDASIPALESAVGAALASGDDPEAIEARREAAKTRDWATIADTLHDEITATLSGRSRNP